MIASNRLLRKYLLGTTLWLAAGIGVAQGAEPLSALKPMASDRAATISAVLDELLNAIDRKQFDLDARLDSLDFDEAEIIEFVTAEIAYEDYPGVLRGAQGTLVSRAGNSLDQSVLLAYLLKETGLDARIVQGKAPHALLLAALHQQHRQSLPAFSEPGVLSGVAAKLAGSAAEPGVLEDDQQAALREAAVVLPDSLTTLSGQIRKEVRQTGLAFPATAGAEVQGRVPYFWVEYRDGSAKPWQAVHPALGAENVPGDILAETYLVDEVGEALQQRISVQAFIDRTRGGKQETLPVTARYEYPAANLSGVTFTYSVIPSAFLVADGSPGDRGEELLAASELFFPVFDFGAGSLAQAFDINGTVLSADDAASAMAPLFQTVGNRFLSATDALDGSRTSSAGGSATTHVLRHWIEFRILRPGLEPKIITRDIARWQGDADRFKRSVARSAFFRVEAGHVSPAKFLDRNLTSQREVLESLASDQPLAMDQGLMAQFSEDAEVFLLTSDVVAAQNEATVSYRAEPSIVARYLPYGRIDAGLEGFDIMNAPRYAVSKADNRPDPEATLFSGVVDTWLEHELFARESWSRSAYGRLQEGIDQGGALTVLSGNTPALLGSLPAQTRVGIEKDLLNNQLAVLSGAPASCDAWWRVDPTSGETLGMLANGWGGTLSEYLVDLAAIHGRLKIASIAANCGLVVSFIAASAAINTLGLLQLDEAAGFQGMDLCSQMPPNLQVLCTATVMAANMAAATGLGQAGLSKGVLIRICVMSAL